MDWVPRSVFKNYWNFNFRYNEIIFKPEAAGDRSGA
jgi:hypothetical protein